VKLFTRGGIAASAIAVAAFVAAGCGGSGGSGASSAAKDSAALDLVPKDAIAYVTLDTDLEGEGWKQFNELATAFDPEFKGVSKEIEDSASEDEKSETTYKDDVDPWLGDSAGAALLAVNQEGDDADFFMWAELEDKAKFEAFAKDQKWKSGKDIGDWKTYTDPEDETNNVAYSDDLVVLAPSRKQLETRVEYDGDSITDAEGVTDAVDEAGGDDALVTAVLSGAGVRKLIEENEQLKQLSGNKRLKDFQAAAFSVAAEDEGMRISGFVGAEGEESTENVEHPIFEDLPASTIFAVGGEDFGGTAKELVNEAGKESKQIQQGIGAAEAALGVTLDDLADALDGEFVLGLSADDAGLASLVGGAAGAAMGGGTSGLDPSKLLSSGSLILAFEETGDTAETLGKALSSGAALAQAQVGKEATMGDFKAQTMTISGVPVTSAANDDLSVIQVGKDVLGTWGDESLGDSDAYKDAWKAADAPGESAGVFWLDAGRIAKLVGVKSGDERELGGLVGWAEADGSNAKFGAFLHVPEA
jgi:hypothetical protein